LTNGIATSPGKEVTMRTLEEITEILSNKVFYSIWDDHIYYRWLCFKDSCASADDMRLYSSLGFSVMAVTTDAGNSRLEFFIPYSSIKKGGNNE
jgi:hypothetical protein